ncbi:MAG: hypothetical protein ACR2QM_04830 [Longimicrobiales bacterium]
MSNDQVKVFGFIMTASLALSGGAATLGHRFLGTGAADSGGGVFHGLMYGSATVLLLLIVGAPLLAGRLGESTGQARGRLLAMAITEGAALLGLVAAAFAGESLWAIALALVGILVLQRLTWSEAG